AISTLHLNAQYSLSGKIVTEAGQAVQVGNVVLLSPKDSSLIRGDLFMEGTFQFDQVMTSAFLLKVSALGYEAAYRLVETAGDAIDLDVGAIVLNSQMLEGVEVVAQRALFEQKGSNLTINVANTALSNAGSAMDVLRNSPKVLVNNSGQLSVIGKGAALIYVDGQLVASTQILDNLTSNDLKKVEVIENPPAKYDAAGNAVINIVTKSGGLEGFKIGLVQEAGQGKHFRSFFKAGSYYKANDWLFQASYGLRPWIRGGREYYFRTFDFENTLTEVDNKLKYDRQLLMHDVSFRTAFQLTANSKIGAQYTALLTHGEKDAINRNIYNENGATAFNLNTEIVGPYDQNSHIANIYYEQQLDTLGSNWLVTAQYSNFDLERLENIDQLYENDSGSAFLNKRTFNTNDIDVLTAQLDYQKVWNAAHTTGMGIKNANIANSSLLNFESQQEDGTFQLDPTGSNNYDYYENILAAYVDWKWTLEKTNITAGLRSEWTHVDRATETDFFATQSYVNLFPSLSINHTFSDQTTLSLGYNRRIQRPQFQDLNPFVFYVDSLVSLRGNASLVPAFVDAFSASIAYRGWNLSLNYNYTDQPINTVIQVTDFDNPGTFAFVRDNILSTQLYAAALARSVQYKTYSAYFMLGVRYEDHRVQDVANLLENRKAGYY
ncbi:MAG: outer membrane beta-barrel family protein, partial [Bacteroidota bacterium]